MLRSGSVCFLGQGVGQAVSRTTQGFSHTSLRATLSCEGGMRPGMCIPLFLCISESGQGRPPLFSSGSLEALGHGGCWEGLGKS